MMKQNILLRQMKESVTGLLRPHGLEIRDLVDESQKSEKTGHEEQQWISAREALKMFSLNRWALARMAKNGQIESTKLNQARSGKVLYSVASIENLIERNKRKGVQA